MRRFICEQNIAHFQKLLGEAKDPTLRRTVQSLLVSARRELALLESVQSGADRSPVNARRRRDDEAQVLLDEFRPHFEAAEHPYMLINPGPGLHIVDVNPAYARATLVIRNEVIGRSLFEVFPDNPDDEFADGVSNLFASLRRVVSTGHPHAMEIQRYDIRDTNGEFVERHWQPINSPIHDGSGILIFILHHVEDVTGDVLSSARASAARDQAPR